MMCILSIRFFLPFVPPVGMTITIDGWSCVVEELAYKNGDIIAYAPEDMSLYRNPGSRDIQDIVDEYLDYGWEVSE